MQSNTKGPSKRYSPVPVAEYEKWFQIAPKLRTQSHRRGGGVPVSAANANNYWNGYLQASRILNAIGCFDPGVPPHQRWTNENVEALTKARKPNGGSYAPATIGTLIFGIYYVLKAIDPAHDYDHLLAWHARFPRESSRPKTIVHPDQMMAHGIAEMTAALAGLPANASVEDLIREPQGHLAYTINRYRDGYLLCWIVETALRLANVEMTERGKGKNLYDVDGDWWLTYDRRVMKGRRDYDRLFPPELIPWHETYEKTIHPLLCRGRYRGDRLWISWRGEPLTDQGIRKAIGRLVWRTMKVRMAPHWIRDCVATAIAAAHPEDTSGASWKLANRSDTMNRVYNHAGKAPARRAVANRFATALAHGHACAVTEKSLNGE